MSELGGIVSQGQSLGLVEQLQRNVGILAVLAVFDLLVARKVAARWFAVHAFANLLVVLTGANSLKTCVTDPDFCCDSRVYRDEGLFGDASKWPVMITNAVHVYHVLAFELSADERFHHFMFIPTIGLMGQFYSWGALQGAIGFFLSGLPGGIDYLHLTLVKAGYMPVMAQKRISAALNVYMRGPCITILSFITYQGFLYGRTTVPLAVGVLICLVSGFNALYYTKQSVANYSLSFALDLLKVNGGVMEEKTKTLKRELSQPQQTMS